MMKYLLSCIIICFTFAAQAQDYDKEVKDFFSVYENLLKQGDWSKTLDYVHPSLFELAPREQVAKAMEGMLNAEEFKAFFDDIELYSISEPFALENVKYIHCRYGGTMRFKYDTSFDKEMMESILSAMRVQFGKDAVEDLGNNMLKIKPKDKSCFLIQDPGKEWKILEYNKDQPVVLAKLIPVAVRDHFKLD